MCNVANFYFRNMINALRVTTKKNGAFYYNVGFSVFLKNEKVP